MDYVTGLARKVKGETQITTDVGLSPGSRNATDFVSLFHKIKKNFLKLKSRQKVNF